MHGSQQVIFSMPLRIRLRAKVQLMSLWVRTSAERFVDIGPQPMCASLRVRASTEHFPAAPPTVTSEFWHNFIGQFVLPRLRRGVLTEILQRLSLIFREALVIRVCAHASPVVMACPFREIYRLILTHRRSVLVNTAPARA